MNDRDDDGRGSTVVTMMEMTMIVVAMVAMRVVSGGQLVAQKNKATEKIYYLC
jgi:hypothetical protein